MSTPPRPSPILILPPLLAILCWAGCDNAAIRQNPPGILTSPASDAAARRGPGKPTDDIDKIESSFRQALMPPELIVKALGIKPKMRILDVGAGPGAFTLPFAKALNGTGRVFATDIDAGMLKHLQMKIEKSGYRNIVPVLVDRMAEGSDPFYKTQTFDIVFMSRVFEGLARPADFLRELRPSLAPGGRIFIVQCKRLPDFSKEDVDSRKVLEYLASAEDSDPLERGLRKDVRDFASSWGGGGVPAKIQEALVEDLNMMLSDPRLYSNLYDSFVELSAKMPNRPGRLSLMISFENRRLFQWLVAELTDAGVWGGRKSSLSPAEERGVRKLNWIIITDVLDQHRFETLASRGPFFPMEMNYLISVAEGAGYELVKEHGFLTHYDFLEFKKKGRL